MRTLTLISTHRILLGWGSLENLNQMTAPLLLGPCSSLTHEAASVVGNAKLQVCVAGDLGFSSDSVLYHLGLLSLLWAPA